jgi:hypothetical protein
MTTWQCPKCLATIDARGAIQIGHICPSHKTKWVDWVPLGPSERIQRRPVPVAPGTRERVSAHPWGPARLRRPGGRVSWAPGDRNEKSPAPLSPLGAGWPGSLVRWSRYRLGCVGGTRGHQSTWVAFRSTGGWGEVAELGQMLE